MGGKPEERLRWKEHLHSLGVELERDFGLSAIASRALLQRIGEFLETSVSGEDGTRGQWQIIYPTVTLRLFQTCEESGGDLRCAGIMDPTTS